MAPLYTPCLDENGAGANLYPACWICIKNVSVPGTNCITAKYNFVPGAENDIKKNSSAVYKTYNL